MKNAKKCILSVFVMILIIIFTGCGENSQTLLPVFTAETVETTAYTETGVLTDTAEDKTTEPVISPLPTSPSIGAETEVPTETPKPTVVVPTVFPPTEHIVSSFDELNSLIGSGMIKNGEIIHLAGDMEISSPIKLYRTVSFSVEAKINCSYPIEIENFNEAMDCFVTVKDGVDVSGLDIRYDTPNCNLTWQGKSSYSDEERVAEVMNVKSYNGVNLLEKYGMGGISWKKMVSFEMRVEDNPNLKAPLTWTIDGNTAYLALSYMADLNPLKNAVVSMVMVDGAVLNEVLDLTQKEQTVTTKDCDGDKRQYKIITEIIEYNLPVVYIEIEDGKEVTSKEEYLSATIRISTENAAYGDFPELSEREVLIRGRGHFTWRFDKTPYKLRFETKTSVLVMNASKNWVLLANYVDRSLIQNYVAMEMGKVLSNISYHSSQYPVDVFVNGTYRGVYTLGEQLEAKEERIDLEESYEDPDTDYLLEIGGSDEGDVLNRDYFHAGTLKFVAIKHPDSSQLTNEQLAYLKDYVSKADTAVRTLTNYEDYIDVDSLIDWVIIHELTYNLDCCFRRSCYLIKEKGGKLKMGPIWDFDLAFGSYYRYTKDNFATVGSDGGYVGITWMNYLMKDDAFMEKFTARWNDVKEQLLDKAITSVDYMSELVKPSAEMNFEVWDILGKSVTSQPSSHKKYDTYEKMIGRLKDFINNRYKWLDEQLN